MTSTSGILLVDKAPDWTSHDVVSFIRGFGFKKVGHAGTLDPAATGLLIILIGKQATRKSELFSGQNKIYSGVIRLGTATHTQDAEGDVIEESPWNHVNAEMIAEIAATFMGDQEQIPPMVSALKHKGKRLYQLARKGIEVERPPRPISISEFLIADISLPDFSIKISCSKGTYVRTIAHDFGKKLKSCAHLKSLRREQSGQFNIEQAFDIDTIKNWDKNQLIEHLITIDE